MAAEQSDSLARLITASAKSTIVNYVDSQVRSDAEEYEKSIWERFSHVRTKKSIAHQISLIAAENIVNLRDLEVEVFSGSPFEVGEKVCLIEEIGNTDTPRIHRIDDITDSRVANISSSTITPSEIKEGTVLNFTQNGVPVSELLRYTTFIKLKFAIGVIVKEKIDRGLRSSRRSYLESLVYTKKGILRSLLRLAGKLIPGKRYKEVVAASDRLLTTAKARLVDKQTLLKLIEDKKLGKIVNEVNPRLVFVIGVNLGRDIVLEDYRYLNPLTVRKENYIYPDVDFSGIIIVETERYRLLKESVGIEMENHKEKLRSALIGELSSLLEK